MTLQLACLRRTSLAAIVTVAGALASGAASADDPTIDTTQFVSSANRSDVNSTYKQQSLHMRLADEYARDNPPSFTRTGLTRGDARSEYRAARQEVSAMTAEDGGAGYHWKMSRRPSGASVMGGPGK